MKRLLLIALLSLGACHHGPTTPAPPPPPMQPMKDIAHFKMLTKESRWADVKATVGEPDSDSGSGLHLYLYKLADGSVVKVSTPDNDQIFYIDWKRPDGHVERLVGSRR